MRLNRSHFKQVRKLLMQNKSRTINGYDFEKGLNWIRDTYLAQVPNYFIFGSFHEGELVSITCLITSFPRAGYGYVGNVFYKPGFRKEKVKIEASEEAYRMSVEMGCPHVISCVLEKRYQSQWNLVSRYSGYLKCFEIEPLLKIPAGVYPKEPWLQLILGHHPSPEDCILRKATYRAVAQAS